MQLNKAKDRLESELAEKVAMLEQNQSVRAEMDRRRKAADASISEQQSRIKDLENERDSLSSTVSKVIIFAEFFLLCCSHSLCQEQYKVILFLLLLLYVKN